MLTRRQVIAGLAGACALSPIGAGATTTIRPQTRLDNLVPMIDPVLDIHNTHTNERLSARYYGPTGYDMQVIRQFNWLMRDHRQAEAVQMDARLFWTLSAIRMAAIRDGHSGRIILLSGYRTQRTNQMLRERGIAAARNSLHLDGKAADITMPGVRIAHLAAYARWLEVGGVGSYGRSNFVHIDSGPERSWGS